MVGSVRFCSLAAILCLFATERPSHADIMAYSFYGPNEAYSAKPGDIGGGYFAFDPATPGTRQQLTDIFGGFHPGWYKDVYNLSGTKGAIDDSLADNVAPGYINGAFTEVDSTAESSPTGGFFRYGPLGTFQNITIYTNTGPPLAPVPPPLGSVFALGPSYVAGGPLTSIDRYTAINHPTITPISVMDIFKNPASLKQPTVIGPQIIAEFTPQIKVGGYDVPIDMKTLASLYGVDHFNWLQEVTHIPSTWSVAIASRLGLAETPIATPYRDPIDIPNSYYITHFIDYRDFPDEIASTYSFVPDIYPYYYNEDSFAHSVRFVTGDSSLSFYDAPLAPFRMYLDPLHPEPKSFRTELVGVKADKSMVRTGLGFTWSSNSFHLSGAEVFRDATQRGDFMPITGGGITDVQLFYPGQVAAVPEPSNLTLFASVMLSVAGWSGVRRWRAAA